MFPPTVPGSAGIESGRGDDRNARSRSATESLLGERAGGTPATEEKRRPRAPAEPGATPKSPEWLYRAGVRGVNEKARAARPGLEASRVAPMPTQQPAANRAR